MQILRFLIKSRGEQANLLANRVVPGDAAEDLGLADGEMPAIKLKQNEVVSVSIRERDGEETTFNVLLGPSIKTLCVEFKLSLFGMLQRLTNAPLSESEDEDLKDTIQKAIVGLLIDARTK